SFHRKKLLIFELLWIISVICSCKINITLRNYGEGRHFNATKLPNNSENMLIDKKKVTKKELLNRENEK
ncbi:CLUMA_CG019127, isoform C, partial [Clunio marinus]